jgi:hypothetical protein
MLELSPPVEGMVKVLPLLAVATASLLPFLDFLVFQACLVAVRPLQGLMRALQTTFRALLALLQAVIGLALPLEAIAITLHLPLDGDGSRRISSVSFDKKCSLRKGILTVCLSLSDRSQTTWKTRKSAPSKSTNLDPLLPRLHPLPLLQMTFYKTTRRSRIRI